MKTFSRGQKGKIAEFGCTSRFSVVIDVSTPGADIDISCFGLDGADKLSDDRYMVFFNQLASPGNAISLRLEAGIAHFAVDLAMIPETIAKLVFAASIDGSASMRTIGQSSLTIGDAMKFPFSGADFSDEKALVIAELYRRGGEWRVGAVGQGFNGGLSALLQHFGGAEAAPCAASQPAPTAALGPAPVIPQSKVSLSKITLEKRGDKISLDKRGKKDYGRIRINLNWDQNAPAREKTGFLSGLLGGGARKGIDLDLACIFEMADGTPGLVQALGNNWGNFASRPYIHLAGDDRTGTVSDGENIYINGEHFNDIKRVVVFAFIYEGVPNWAATDGVVTIHIADQSPIEVKLDQGGNQIMCAIALIENRGGELQVTKLVDYFEQRGITSAHELLDRKYGFGLRWKTGTKD